MRARRRSKDDATERLHAAVKYSQAAAETEWCTLRARPCRRRADLGVGTAREAVVIGAVKIVAKHL